jgi:HTH-type transcriptional regulator/antitoxin HipB
MPLTAYLTFMLKKAYAVLMLLLAYTTVMDYLLRSPSQLASHLRSLRNSRRLTQAQLGTLVGLDQTRIAKIEKDPRRISVGQLLKILGVLGVQVALQSKPAKSNTLPDDAAGW